MKIDRTSENWQQIRQLEAVIRQSDVDALKAEGVGLRARWESGKCYLSYRKGKKRLPNGVLAELAKEVRGGAWEVDERMKFATDFPTEVELVDAVKKFGSWREMTHRPRGEEQEHAPNDGNGGQDDHVDEDDPTKERDHRIPKAIKNLARATQLINSIDPADLGDAQDLIVMFNEAVRRFNESVASLAREAA